MPYSKVSLKPILVVFAGAMAIAEQWQVLARILEELKEADWPGVRDGLVVSEIVAFAVKPESLASAAQCAPLGTYSRRFHSDADSFSPIALERTLHHRFPSIIKAIRTAGAPSST